MTYRAPSQHAVTPQGKGRFPGFDVLDEVHRWDDVTAGVVLARLAPTTDLSFFTVEEDAVATPLCDLLMAQDGEPKVPVVALVDARLAVGETDGWHYDGMPQDADAWRRTLACLDEDAQSRFARGFAELDPSQQAALVQAVQDTDGDWHGYSARHVWSLWTRYACTAFYSHPWAWNEIGFPGPAYPRGYLNLGVDARDKWEARDAEPTDPVTAGRRLEQARKERSALLGRELR